MFWDEFKKDNPFGLTETQFNRVRRYFPDYKPTDKYLRSRERVGRNWIWICECGETGRGSSKRSYAKDGHRRHERLKHGGEYCDRQIIYVGSSGGNH